MNGIAHTRLAGQQDDILRYSLTAADSRDVLLDKLVEWGFLTYK